MSERITEAELREWQSHAANVGPLSANQAWRAVAEVRRLRGLIVAPHVVRNPDIFAAGRALDEAEAALVAEARAIREESGP